MKKIIGTIACSLLAGCGGIDKQVIQGPSPGIEYHNQDVAPWPWVSVVPTHRALILKNIDFDNLARELRFEMAFDPYSAPFKDVRLVILDYTVLPELIKGTERSPERDDRYFLTASFYKLDNRPPCPADFEITATTFVNQGGGREIMRYMIGEIVDLTFRLYESNLLVPGKKITISLNQAPFGG